MEEELRVYYGTLIWKSGLEYYNEYMFLHGRPYYRITKTDDTYYLWELDRNDPNSLKYKILKTHPEFDDLYKEGMELQEALREQLFPDDRVLPEEWKKEHKSGLQSI